MMATDIIDGRKTRICVQKIWQVILMVILVIVFMSVGLEPR
jgi:hypothetical protein